MSEKIWIKTEGYDDDPKKPLRLETVRQIMETIQPHQVNGFIADFHQVLRIFSEKKAEDPKVRFDVFYHKPD